LSKNPRVTIIIDGMLIAIYSMYETMISIV
jgi:hypothetical protein